MSEISQAAASISSLLNALSRQAIPWAEQWEVSRLVVAQPSLKELNSAGKSLPPGVTASRKKLRGRRVTVKGTRFHGNVRIISARWPDDHLEVKRVPMITCSINGQADLHVGDYILHCAEGHFIFLPPGVPHFDGSRAHLEATRQENDCCDLLSLCPMGDVLHCWLCHSRNQKHWSGLEEHCYLSYRPALGYLDALMQEAAGQREGHEKICQGLLVALLTTVHRELQEGNFFRWVPQAAEAPDTAGERDPIKLSQTYIRSHLSEPLTLDRVAHTIYMSRSHFAKRFHQETGQTFIEFLTQCRLAEAKAMLRDTSWSVAAISQSVGITPARLLQIFRHHTGVAPREYRRSTRNPERYDITDE